MSRSADPSQPLFTSDDHRAASSSFLACMCHEIRTPLAAILGFADLLCDTDLPPNERRDCAEAIRRNSSHLLPILNDLLDLSKINADRMTIERVPVSPLEILDDAIALLNPRAAAKNITLRAQTPTQAIPLVRTDPTRLRQILINLIGNAIKFTATGGVVVRLALDAAPSPTLRFSVIDTGIGLTHEQMDRLFTPFTQADHATTRNFGGTGLGLWISRELATLLGGDLTASSIPGAGSTFTVTIHADLVDANPTAPPDADDSQTRAHPSAPPQPLADARILVVEDSPDIQRLIAFHLQRAGAHVEIVANGHLAIERLASTAKPPIDLVLMDMQMPVMDGYQAARHLRTANHPASSTPIIALTAHALDGDRDHCVQSGCVDYLTKPIDRVKLIETCARWLAVSRAKNPQKRDGASPPRAPSVSHIPLCASDIKKGG